MGKVSTLTAIARLLILADGPGRHALLASEDNAVVPRQDAAAGPHLQCPSNGVRGRVVIPNVPFVSWADAAQIDVHDKFLNPSTFQVSIKWLVLGVPPRSSSAFIQRFSDPIEGFQAPQF